MEWVEVTGKTIAEAKDRALDRLGVDEREAEFEVLEEPVVGLFGRLKREARVRARVRPAAPRGRTEGRDRRRKRGGSDRKPESGAPARPRTTDDTPRQPAAKKNAERTPDRPRTPPTTEGQPVSLENQAEIATSFMQGLLTEFGVDGRVSWDKTADDHAEIQVEGDELGLLIGPKGRTLSAINEIARAVVLRQLDSAPEGRVHIDIAGYRQRRREALERFARSLAEQVAETGVRRVLEPMSAPDRKIVHDAVTGIAGVKTLSEGEDPNRRVVIAPAD